MRRAAKKPRAKTAKTKKDKPTAPIIFWEAASIAFYVPAKNATYEREPDIAPPSQRGPTNDWR
jgi:hypothetical protein